MNSAELQKLRNTVNEADRLLRIISRIGETIKKLSGAHCDGLMFEHYGQKPAGLFDCCDEEDHGWIPYMVDSESLGLTKEEFREWFSQPLVEYLAHKRNETQEKYDALEHELLQ